MRKKFTITFLSDWHIASGLGNAEIADSVLHKDANGLPFISGRAVKGALREGARRLGLCRADLQDCENVFFGTKSTAKTSNEPGLVQVSGAALPLAMQHMLLKATGQERQDLLCHLTTLRRQTALENGTAKHGSLRALECGIPYLRFEGVLTIDMLGLAAFDMPGLSTIFHHVPEVWVETWLHAAAAAVKSMGGNRSRGFGECQLRFENHPEQIIIPAPLPQLVQEEESCNA